MSQLRSLLASKSDSAAVSKSIEATREEAVSELQADSSAKDSLLRQQECRIQELIVQWEEEKERIRISHCQDRDDLAASKAKYADLKRKVRGYQKHSREKEAHYKAELEEQAAKFEAILLLSLITMNTIAVILRRRFERRW